MIPLALMFARMAEEQRQADNDLTKFRMRGSHDRQPQPFMPMRPMDQPVPEAPRGQVGQIPPLTLSQLFEAMK